MKFALFGVAVLIMLRFMMLEIFVKLRILKFVI
jgi:hypothetical protein